MADLIGVDIKGLAELERDLLKLGDKMAKSVTRKAMSKARKVVVKEARNRVPVRHGALKKSIGAKRITRSRTQSLTDIIGARSRPSTVNGKKVNPAMYAHLVEFGTKPHAIKPKGGGLLRVPGVGAVASVNHPGARPQPFMRPAWMSKRNTTLRTFINEYRKGVIEAGRTA